MGTERKPPTIELAVGLPADGNLVYTIRAADIATIGDMELLLAAAFNGLNVHMANYCAQEGIPLVQAQLRVQRMIQELAKGNDTSPMQFQAQSNDDPIEETGEGPARRGIWGDDE